MTDKEAIVSMLRKITVKAIFQTNVEFIECADGSTSIKVFSGYDGFYTQFEFDAEGVLETIGAYE